MISIIRAGSFLIPPAGGVIAVALTSLVLFAMVSTSKETRVRTSDARCEVGEVVSGSETIRVKLLCDEQGVKTSTLTSQLESVVAILKTNSTAVVCNVMHTGWARDCRVP
jgi:hypothetical protein